MLALFASPYTRGLFHKGIAESPYGLPSHTRAQAEKIGIDVATAMGLPGEKATLEELQAIPADKLKMLKGKGLSLAPSLVAGDAVLPEPILDIFKKGKQAPVPLIIGSNSNEASVAEAFGVDPKKLVEHVGILKLVRRELYPDVHDEAQYGREVVRDMVFLTFAKRIAETHSLQSPAFRYYFDYVPDQIRGKEPGVPHGGEIVFVFGSASLSKTYHNLFSNPDRLMSFKVGNYWHAFAKTGRPEVEGQPTWPSTNRGQNNVLEFGSPITPRNDFMKKRLDAFDEVLHLLDHFR
ncbi:MAG: carboxylesterase family protein [Gemmatales bacterium]